MLLSLLPVGLPTTSDSTRWTDPPAFVSTVIAKLPLSLPSAKPIDDLDLFSAAKSASDFASGGAVPSLMLNRVLFQSFGTPCCSWNASTDGVDMWLRCPKHLQSMSFILSPGDMLLFTAGQGGVASTLWLPASVSKWERKEGLGKGVVLMA